MGERAGDTGHRLRGHRPGGQARAADRGGRAGRAVLRRPEGLVGDAAQAEPDPLGANLRPGQGGPWLRHAGDGGHGTVARTRYLTLQRGAGGAARCRHRDRLPRAPHRGRHLGPDGIPGPDEGEPGIHRRADIHLEHPARAGAGRAVQGGRLCAGPGRRHGRVGHRGQLPGDAAQGGGGGRPGTRRGTPGRGNPPGTLCGTARPRLHPAAGPDLTGFPAHRTWLSRPIAPGTIGAGSRGETNFAPFAGHGTALPGWADAGPGMPAMTRRPRSRWDTGLRANEAFPGRDGRRAVHTGPSRYSVLAVGRPNKHPRSSVSMTVGPETCYRVKGGEPLRGTVFVQGAKNAALKMIAASLLASEGRTVLRNVPPIEDVRRAIELAQAVGAVVKFHEAERTLVVDASQLTSPVLPAEITRRFRGSVLFVPALLHRLGEAVIEGIGGCNLGSRNLDFHYRGFARLGATVDGTDDKIYIKAGRMRGAHLYLDTPSHTGTENLIMAASLSPGKTVIDNTALEPEVLDVIAFLSKMGAN